MAERLHFMRLRTSVDSIPISSSFIFKKLIYRLADGGLMWECFCVSCH